MSILLQVYDATETHLVQGDERSVQAILVTGITPDGGRTSVVVTDVPHEIYCDARQLGGSSVSDVMRRLNTYLLSKPAPCKRAGCCSNSETSKFVSYEACVKDRRTDRRAVSGFDTVMRRGFEVYEEDERPFVRVRLSRSYFAKPAKDFFQRMDVDVYDVTPNAVESFMLLKDVAGFTWYSAPADVCSFDEFVAVKDRDDVAKLKHVVFDIESVDKVYANDGTENGHYPVGCIVCSWSETEYVAYMLGTPAKGYVEPAQNAKTDIKYYQDEMEMLRAFRVEALETAQFVSGWNSDDFDLRYLFARAKRLLGDDSFATFTDGRVMRIVLDESMSGEKKKRERKVICPGLISVDYLKLIKKDTRIKPYDYKLSTIADFFGGGAKGDMPYDQIFDAFHGTPERRGDLLTYCAQDVLLTRHIGTQAGLMTKLVAKCRVKGILPRDEMYRGVSFASVRKVRQYLAGQFLMYEPREEWVGEGGRREKRKAIPRAFKEIEGYVEKVYGKKYEGGFVRDPLDPKNKTAGVYYGFRVATLDFNSLYPSIMRTYNICRSTQLKRPGQLGDDAMEWVSDLGFAFAQNREGVMPKILRLLVDERNAIRKRQKTEKDPVVWEQLEAYQTELKIMANGLYGLTGTDTCALVLKSAAASTCARGAYLAKRACELITERFSGEMGLKVIYGDTDSLMIFFEKSDGADQTLAWLNRVATYINVESGLLHGHLKMGMEDVCNMLLVGKKTYCKYTRGVDDGEWVMKNGVPSEPKIKIAGMDNRSRTPYVRFHLKKMFEHLLKEGGERVTDMYVEAIRTVASGLVELKDLKHSSALTKPTKDYTNEKHAVAARQMEAAKMTVCVGDRVEYYWCLVLGTSKEEKKSEMVVAAPFVQAYDLDWRAYAEETIKAFESLKHVVKGYDTWSKAGAYTIKKGTWRKAPETLEAFDSKKRPMERGTMNKFVESVKRRKELPKFSDMVVEGALSNET